MSNSASLNNPPALSPRNSGPTSRWRGIIPPLATPLKAADEIDILGLERLIEHVIAGGVHGLFVLGTTGEAPHLSHSVRRDVVRAACGLVKGRTRLLVGITDTSLADSVKLARFAADCGADAVVCAAPFYFPLDQIELVEYLRRLAAEIPLPMFLYNIPQLTKTAFEPESLRRLTSIARIIGLKDSGGDFTQFKELLAVCRERDDWSVLIGPEHLLCAATALGGDGGVPGGANFHPRLFVDAYEAAACGDAGRMAECHRQIMQLGSLYSIGVSSTSTIQGVKGALAAMGICDDVMSAPFCALGEADRSRIRQVLVDAGLA